MASFLAISISYLIAIVNSGVSSLVGGTLTTWYSSLLIASLWKWNGQKHITYRLLGQSIFGQYIPSPISVFIVSGYSFIHYPLHLMNMFSLISTCYLNGFWLKIPNHITGLNLCLRPYSRLIHMFHIVAVTYLYFFLPQNICIHWS